MYCDLRLEASYCFIESYKPINYFSLMSYEGSMKYGMHFETQFERKDPLMTELFNGPVYS